MIVFEDAWVTLEQADFCSVPGYLVMRLKSGVESMGDLEPETASHVGQVLSRAARALEAAAGAERVYILTFAEIDRRLHFHLFPRTREIKSAFLAATGGDPAAVNGPLLFEWARESYPADRPPPGDRDSAGAMLRSVAARLADG
jgi:diadenosine tetraphosphate (Ap4A) HIT family hydrolase